MRVIPFVRRSVAALVLALLLLLGIASLRAVLTPSKQPRAVPPTVPAFAPMEAAQRLGQAVRFQTVSIDGAPSPNAELLHLQEYLQRTFPLVHSTLSRENIADLSLLYKWEGSDVTARPILLLAHQDVVPVEPGSEAKWEYPPFSGEVQKGFIWGRGTLDDKSSVLAILEAVEWLLSQGHRPARTIYIAFGHDEEKASSGGAFQVAEALRSRGVRLEMTLDEGLSVTQGLMPGLSREVALIGMSEKGYANLEIEAVGQGGHASMPPKQTPIGLLSHAMVRLEDNTMPQSIRPPVSDMFEWLAPEMSFPLRLVLTNQWLFSPVLRSQLSAKDSTRAMLQTTQAPTMLFGSPKSNVLPQSVKVVVNYRIRPGDTSETLLAHVRKVVADDRLKVQLQPGSVTEPSPVSEVSAPMFSTVTKTILSLFPDAVVAPGLMLGASDSRHFTQVSDSVYRFAPFVVSAEDLPRFHGNNERIKVSDYLRMIRFYAQLIRNVDAAP